MAVWFNRVTRRVVCATGLALATAAWGQPAAPAQPEKVLRYAFRVAETGFDPAQLSDLYSRILAASIFDALYMYDYLARPFKVVPNVADGMPEVSADFRTWTVKLRKGIHFASDPAFNGQKRELTAHDFVYSFKRIADPKTKSPSFSSLNEEKFVGLSALRKAAEQPGAKFDFDTEIEGIRALDRYTIQFKLEEPRPRFLYSLADGSIVGAVAREVVEKYGDKIMEHPVGTGPFKLSEWRRSSKIVMVRNPDYREEFYKADPPKDDPVSQAIYARMKGKRLPMIDKVQVDIIEENQPRWLAFLNAEHDFLERLPEEVVNQAIPNGKVAPNLAKKGITMDRGLALDVVLTYFAMDHPVIGGYTPEKVALRRAIALAYNSDEEIRLPRRNQAVVSQGPIYPGMYGHDPNFRSEMGTFDRARAMALLDMYGYTDKNGDGWRDLPDGKPLLLEYATEPDSARRELAEIWKRNMDAVGIKMVFKVSKWPENLKASRAGKLMMWGLGLSAATPDGAGIFALGYGKAIGNGLNHPRFRNAEFDTIYQKLQLLPDGPERFELMQRAAKIMVTYMPVKFSGHRYITDMSQPWVIGYRRNPLVGDFWKYVDIDTSLLPR